MLIIYMIFTNKTIRQLDSNFEILQNLHYKNNSVFFYFIIYIKRIFF